MLIKACLNGTREPGEHPRLPVAPTQLAADAQACVEFGAEALHVHPRDDGGRESLTAEAVAKAVAAIRQSCPDIPIGVTTGGWIVPDPDQRAALITGWAELGADSRPDFASVNISEPGAEQVAAILLDAGIDLEIGIWEPEDPPRLAASRLASRAIRLLVEPLSTDPEAAVRSADSLVASLLPLADDTPLLVHGRDAAAWPVLEWAVDHEHDTRIGLEDTLELPDGVITLDNAALLAAAHAYRIEPH
ncbi:MAG: 3-keto-5-aminohexanoate cleavage protein [Micromonosporaceae bacterium]